MENIINDKDVVFMDEKGYVHRIDIANIVGTGAQGAVYRGENKNILIKINQTKETKINQIDYNVNPTKLVLIKKIYQTSKGHIEIFFIHL